MSISRLHGARTKSATEGTRRNATPIAAGGTSATGVEERTERVRGMPRYLGRCERGGAQDPLAGRRQHVGDERSGQRLVLRVLQDADRIRRRGVDVGRNL